MTQINVGAGDQSLREFLRGLGTIREPVEVILDGALVAKIVPPTELSETERQKLLDGGWALIQQARKNAERYSEAEIRRVVDAGVREVRARNAQCDP